jgi:hypothetical protein
MWWVGGRWSCRRSGLCRAGRRSGGTKRVHEPGVDLHFRWPRRSLSRPVCVCISMHVYVCMCMCVWGSGVHLEVPGAPHELAHTVKPAQLSSRQRPNPRAHPTDILVAAGVVVCHEPFLALRVRARRVRHCARPGSEVPRAGRASSIAAISGRRLVRCARPRACARRGGRGGVGVDCECRAGRVLGSDKRRVVVEQRVVLVQFLESKSPGTFTIGSNYEDFREFVPQSRAGRARASARRQ